jgi:hypothetical protein
MKKTMNKIVKVASIVALAIAVVAVVKNVMKEK